VTVTTDARRAGAHIRLVRAASCAPARSPSRARRQRRRARRQPVTPLSLSTVVTARAALVAPPERGARWVGLAVWALVLAAHAVLVIQVWRTPDAAPVARRTTRITVQVRDLPPPAPPPAAAPAAPSRPSPPRATRASVSRVPRAPAPAAPPPPAPVKVVGLSLESTSQTGQGPAFAVGDTLAGSTAATAAAPHAPPVADGPPAGPNRVARGLPRAGSVLTPPRRLREVKPHYPDARRAAGVEADVLLVVSLDAAGQVLSVTVGRSSGDEAFDESARAAARQERFSPALRDGVPVPTTFTFTTHFRLDTP
jgi:protein TonB